MPLKGFRTCSWIRCSSAGCTGSACRSFTRAVSWGIASGTVIGACGSFWDCVTRGSDAKSEWSPSCVSAASGRVPSSSAAFRGRRNSARLGSGTMLRASQATGKGRSPVDAASCRLDSDRARDVSCTMQRRSDARHHGFCIVVASRPKRPSPGRVFHPLADGGSDAAQGPVPCRPLAYWGASDLRCQSIFRNTPKNKARCA